MTARTACLAALLCSRIAHFAMQRQLLEMTRWRLAASHHALKKLRAAVTGLNTTREQYQ